jgi:hypothetical protein
MINCPVLLHPPSPDIAFTAQGASGGNGYLASTRSLVGDHGQRKDVVNEWASNQLSPTMMCKDGKTYAEMDAWK